MKTMEQLYALAMLMASTAAVNLDKHMKQQIMEYVPGQEKYIPQ